ncbi:DUF2975 domain-containing protein [Leucobacter viscericola]|uniref:DUF2975 domain-containing protein n=1 Tax=Leucobacter viscericola TaxID=2714935 RepID=A0A6G7XHL7_9MICO|nr:DUF2975 domain-containing protein [Leucobacter viscericola]QIK64055.1 DUF2975 domain-containing protein [Leucobacter viscericola]
MQSRLIQTLRALIALMLLLLLVAQIVAVPLVASTFAYRYPEFAGLELPGIVAAILLILCVQVVFVCVWQLLSLVRVDRIFSRAAFRYVDVILISILAATLIVIIAFVGLILAEATTPTLSLLVVFGIVVGLGLSLLVMVMRGLLTKALQLEQDLSEVV